MDISIKVNKDRIFVALEPMVTELEIEGPGGTKLKVPVSEKHSERSRIGVIQQCGESVEGYYPGDRVLLSTYAGVRIHLLGREINGEKIDEDRHRIIRAEEIVALIED